MFPSLLPVALLFLDLITKIHFPVDDVVTNFRHFITSVKRATGNVKDPDAADRKSSSGARGMHISQPLSEYLTNFYL